MWYTFFVKIMKSHGFVTHGGGICMQPIFCQPYWCMKKEWDTYNQIKGKPEKKQQKAPMVCLNAANQGLSNRRT
jgi:hypothetical protein